MSRVLGTVAVTETIGEETRPRNYAECTDGRGTHRLAERGELRDECTKFKSRHERLDGFTEIKSRDELRDGSTRGPRDFMGSRLDLDKLARPFRETRHSRLMRRSDVRIRDYHRGKKKAKLFFEFY